MTPNLATALSYVRHGVSIFPCREANSRRGEARAPYLNGGMHRATADQCQIQQWWADHPDALVGLPCRANEIIAIDADRHGDGDGVLAQLDLFARQGFDPLSVPCVVTPRDGRHWLFRRPAGSSPTKGKVAQAIDVRDNAYIIAAGSTLADGGCYVLRNGSVHQLAAAIGGETLPELPSWLDAIIAKPMQSRQTGFGHDANSAADLMPRLKGLILKVALARLGERNSLLYWAACRAGELVAAGVLPGEAATAMLVEAGSQAGLSRAEALATALSGIREGGGLS